MSEYSEQKERIKQLGEEFRLKAHLAEMEAKTLWEEELEPWLRGIDHKIDEATSDIDLSTELGSIERKLRKLVDDLIGND